MKMLVILQGLIHKLETGWGARFVRYSLLLLAVALVMGVYDLRCYRNMSAPEAMDAAQLARNISRGRGYTTECIRPLSVFLVERNSRDPAGKDPALLNVGHPDLANAPVYPTVLAGLMKVVPFRYDVDLKHSFWSVPDSGGRRGWRYQPDFVIAVFNQILFLAVITLAFFWAKLLFDTAVAWTSTFMLLGAELLWRFTVSGLSTMLLMLIFMGLLWCLTLCEREGREPKLGPRWPLILSIAAGLFAGAGGLTRYSFLWIIVPVVLFLAFFGGQRRVLLCIAAFVAFTVVMSPWIARNYAVSGTPFGTASYSVAESLYGPEFRLQRSLQPDIASFRFVVYWWKLATNLLPILQSDLFEMAGGWLSAFFLVGLMVGFRNLAIRRLRYFIVTSIVALAVAQALGRTQLSEETPKVNSENLLVLLAPMVLIYAVGFFYVLLDNIKLPFRQMRFVVIGLFALVLWVPMVFAVLTSNKSPVAYPPYRPDVIQSTSHLMQDPELIMSDMPWAVAWYGDRQSIWLTLNATVVDPADRRQWQESFFAVNDALKPVHALYLTPRSLDARFQSDWVRANEMSWGKFIMLALVKGDLPPKFPLHEIPPGYMPEQLLLLDWARW
jgi:hypothetical protein